MKGLFKYLLGISSLLCLSFAAWSTGETIGTVATNITSSFSAITKLFTASFYVGGVAMMAVGIFQFRQHKESPSQVPISKGMTTFSLGALLIFLPTVTQVASSTIFGTTGGTSSTPSGTIIG